VVTISSNRCTTLGARALQLLDDLHARNEALLLRLQIVDLLDLLVDDLISRAGALRWFWASIIEPNSR
jgi:hypothetical protein